MALLASRPLLILVWKMAALPTGLTQVALYLGRSSVRC